MANNFEEVYLHFVWATRDRLPLISFEIERDVHRYISGICERNNCTPFAVGGMEDHIHVLVTLASDITIASLVKQMKGGSSRHISKSLSTDTWFGWQGGYGVLSFAARDKERLCDYVLNQRQHHDMNTLLPNAERINSVELK